MAERFIVQEHYGGGYVSDAFITMSSQYAGSMPNKEQIEIAPLEGKIFCERCVKVHGEHLLITHKYGIDLGKMYTACPAGHPVDPDSYARASARTLPRAA